MGFRSTFVTEDNVVRWPDWFREKYANFAHVPAEGVLSSKMECKTYFTWDGLAEDIRKAIDWAERDWPFVFVWLHECGGITRVEIHQGGVWYNEPDGWANTDGVTHWYCDGCSAVSRPELEKVSCAHCREWFRRHQMQGSYCPECAASRLA